METIFVERAKVTPNHIGDSTDVEQIIDWGMKNYLDPDVLGYPTTQTLKAVSKNKTVLYMPVQVAHILESLAINPDATKHETTVALRQIVSQLRFSAKDAGIGEIYFLGTNEQTNEFASKHDFVELPWKVYRMKTYFEDSNANQSNTPTGLQGREQDLQATTRNRFQSAEPTS